VRLAGDDVVEDLQPRPRGNLDLLERAVRQQRQAVILQQTPPEVLLVFLQPKRGEHADGVVIVDVLDRVFAREPLSSLRIGLALFITTFCLVKTLIEDGRCDGPVTYLTHPGVEVTSQNTN
jgi:hypothetical protein